CTRCATPRPRRATARPPPPSGHRRTANRSPAGAARHRPTRRAAAWTSRPASIPRVARSLGASLGDLRRLLARRLLRLRPFLRRGLVGVRLLGILCPRRGVVHLRTDDEALALPDIVLVLRVALRLAGLFQVDVAEVRRGRQPPHEVGDRLLVDA